MHVLVTGATGWIGSAVVDRRRQEPGWLRVGVRAAVKEA